LHKLMSYNATTGQASAAGEEIPPAIQIAWDDFIELDWAILDGIFYRVSNVHSVGTTGGSLWMADATGDRPILKDRQIQCATFALAVSTYPPATYPDLVIHIADFDIDIISNGSRYIPVGKKARLVHKVFGTLAAPTASISAGTSYSFNTLLGTPTFPANMFAANDILNIESAARRDGANGTMSFKISLGTAGDNTDAAVWTNSLAATDALCINTRSKVIIGSSTAFITNNSSNFSGTGGVSQLVAGTANFATTSAMILSVNSNSKNASDTINLFTLSCDWEVL